MILLDTNLLVYARNSTSPFHKKAKQIRDQAVDGALKAAVTLQTLSEYLAIITDSRRIETPLSPAEAIDDVRSYLGRPIEKIVPYGKNNGTTGRFGPKIPHYGPKDF